MMGVASRMHTTPHDNTGSTRLRGRILIMVRVLCAVVAFLTLALFAVSLPVRFAVLRTPVAIPRSGQLSVQEAEALAQFGLSLHFYAAYELFWTVTPVVVFGVVAGVIAWRKADDWMALLVAVTLITLACVAPPAMASLVEMYPRWRVPVARIPSINFGLLFFLLCLFPNGRFVPRALRWLAAIWTIFVAARVFMPALDQPFYLSGIQTDAAMLLLLWMMLWFGAGVAAQIYRYRFVSTPLERQQTKWVVFGFVGMALLLGFAGALLNLVPALRQPGAGAVLYKLIVIPFAVGALTVLPLSFGFAILRSRLWDIDLLINRTLVYTTLTALLAVIYAGGVVLMQRVFQPFLGQPNQLAVVASTLVIAALFQPLRRRLQTVIDRRFYRRKYDAAKTLQAFSMKMRDETDLDQLATDLVQAVDTTMQPAYVSLWVVEPAQHPSGETSR